MRKEGEEVRGEGGEYYMSNEYEYYNHIYINTL